MKILLTGATGFIGTRLRAALRERGHEVVGVARRAPVHAAGERWIAIDFGQAGAADWQPALDGVDAVVNAVGIFREHGRQTFDALHLRGAQVLFDACVAAGVRRVVQLSALGADDDARSAYHLSKKAADEHLLALPLEAVVVQPSLVFGLGGGSANAFVQLASLPVLPLPAGGSQLLQPVHVDDVVQALATLVETPPGAVPERRVALVGPAPMTLAAYLQSLRHGLQLAPAPTIPIPPSIVTAAARIGDRLPHSLLDSASWQMLQRGNTAAPEAITRLLNRAPRPATRFIPPDCATGVRLQARLAWLLPVLRLSVALVWIVTGIVSLGLFPAEESYRLLARAGVTPAWQPLMLYGAAAFDLLLGALTLAPLRRRRPLWLVQAALIVFYTAVISLKLPEFWLHPYGPVLKNLPLLAVLLLLYMLEPGEERRWNTT